MIKTWYEEYEKIKDKAIVYMAMSGSLWQMNRKRRSWQRKP